MCTPVGGTPIHRVLIADADVHVRKQLYAALLAVDVFADCVVSVPEALARLNAETYGVVLIDIGLPGGAVEQLVACIAVLPRRPVVLVVASNPSAARSLDVDVVQIVLRKPIALRQTVDVIRSCIESAAVRDAREANSDRPTC